MTFIVDQKRCTSAIEQVIMSLEYLAKIDIDTAPRKNLDNIIKILISVCIDLNIQMQNAQRTMGTMS